MNKIGFVLGRESELSKAEIFSVIRKNNETYKILLNTKNILILETNFNDFNISVLGGTIKLFNILGQIENRNELANYIQNNIEISQAELRVNFGISGYGKIDKNYLYSAGKKIKDKLVESGLKARLVTGKFPDLSSVIVTENKLIERGFEAIIIEDKGKLWIGQTIAVQNYKAYSKRDYGRTSRDDKSGMLPPKLAQIMINLGQSSSNNKIYDPFCGSGTVLQEAILLGFNNFYGSDISEKAVNETKENLNWLISSHSEHISESKKNEILKQVQDDIYISDILDPSRQIKVDLIVGEGYLGEPNRRNVAQAKNDAKKMADFFLKAFTNLGKILNKNGKIVIAVPFFIIGKERVFLPFIEKISLTGLKIYTVPDITMTLRNSLLYARPDSFVGREIFILEKTS